MSKYNWILDAGHGGVINGKYVTAGKRSPIWCDGTQYFEGVGNRNIVAKMLHALKENNIKCIDLLNGSQEDISLKDRVIKINEICKTHKNSILVSIHSDAFTKEQANGYSVYTSVGNTKSDQLANVFLKNMQTYFPKHKLRRDTTDGDNDKEANFYIIYRSICPAILIENFFMTNYRESKLLMDNNFVSRLVDCHIKSIMHVETEKVIF